MCARVVVCAVEDSGYECGDFWPDHSAVAPVSDFR